MCARVVLWRVQAAAASSTTTASGLGVRGFFFSFFLRGSYNVVIGKFYEYSPVVSVRTRAFVWFNTGCCFLPGFLLGALGGGLVGI